MYLVHFGYQTQSRRGFVEKKEIVFYEKDLIICNPHELHTTVSWTGAAVGVENDRSTKSTGRRNGAVDGTSVVHVDIQELQI